MTIYATIQPPRPEWLALAEPEDVLLPDLPIVDTHLHLWDMNGQRYFIEEYARDVASCGHNVSASVFVETLMMYRKEGPEHLKYVGETEFAVGQAAMAASGKYTDSRVAAGIVGFADLTQGELTREALEAHVAAGNGRFRGIRQRAKWDADPVVKGKYSVDRQGFYLEPALGAGLDILTSLGLSFDASIYHPQMPDVAALARAHPDANIILNHTGSPVGHSSYAGQEAKNHSVWLAGLKELARCPNVSVKLGGMLMNLANFDFTAARRPPTSTELAHLWRPYIEPCLEWLGPERCMVSSNFPVDKAGFSYGTVWNMFKHIMEPCSQQERAQVFHGTARRVYRLD